MAVDAFGHVAKGLDRDPLNVYTSLEDDSQRGQFKRVSTIINTKTLAPPDSTRSKPLTGIRRISRSLRSKLHKKSHSLPSVPNDERRYDEPIQAPTLAPKSPAKDDRFSESPPEKPTLPPVKDFITKPIETAKLITQVQGGNDFAQNLAKNDTPHGANVQVIRAYDNFLDATVEDDKDLAMHDLELLKKVRQDSYVRWTLDRHVKSVGRIQAHQLPWKDRKEFVCLDENGRQAMRWREYGRHVFCFYLEYYAGHYIGSFSEIPPFKESVLMASMERATLTSEPLQELYLKMWRIAHWEHESESAIYFAIYVFLWHYNLITTAVLFGFVCLTVQRRLYPPTIDELLPKVKQAEDREATPRNLSQLIEQHGEKGWVEPFLEQAGTTIVSHVEDLADLMETIRNFYEWRSPHRTAVSLGLLTILCVIVAFTPVWILVKATFFIIGVNFFILTPVADYFPAHRLLVSPSTWLFWKIPTHADWAIARLQAEASHQLQKLRGEKVVEPTVENGAAPAKESCSLPPQELEILESDQKVKSTEMVASRNPPVRIGRYHCISENRHGNLCIDTDRVCFQMHLTGSEKWGLRYCDVKNIQKVAGSTTIKSGEDLLFTGTDDQEFRACGLKVRDEVFSQIIGYSNVRWQRSG